jgi:hypothetical protein
MGTLTQSAQDRELTRGVSFGVIGMGGVPGTSFVGLGYLIPNSFWKTLSILLFSIYT